MTGVCPACRSALVALSHRSRRHRQTVVRCRSCGLRYIRERIDETQQTALYAGEEAYRHFAEAERSVGSVPPRRSEWARLLSESLGPGGAAGFGRRPRLLDIGCGAGDFLAVARDAGFEVHGIELSAAAARLARHDHQLEVAVGDFTQERRTGHFEIVTLLGVLEHVRDPARLLDHSRDLLAPGGLLLVYTPVWGAYDYACSGLARISGGRWSRLIDRRINTTHLQIFPQRTLTRWASSHGLIVAESSRLCEYNLPVAHYLRSVGIESARLQTLAVRVLEWLIGGNLFFRNNQRVLISKPS